jgi:hypothetical protein
LITFSFCPGRIFFGSIRLVHDPDRRFGDGLEMVIGDDERELDDAVGAGRESGHFEVDPDQPVRILRHRRIA